MKTYISAGIGDMILLDSLLTLEEKSSITEIYWACRFGKYLIPLMENNPDYPNLIRQHVINDEVGMMEMKKIDPIASPFWHFRPDFEPNFSIGLSLFEINREDVQAIDVSGCFADVTREYVASSFIKNANSIDMKDYMIFHYPTSTRPRTDISTIDDDDWNFVEQLSIEKNIKVFVISDNDIRVPLSNYQLLIKPDIRYIVDLIASCDYYAGCDSFCAHLATKVLPKEKLFIKTHDKNIKNNILTTSFSRCFLPHSPEDISEFYKPYIGYP